MAGRQDVTLKDLKNVGECNTSLLETMMTMLQNLQSQNLKLERRVGGLESELETIRSDMTETIRSAVSSAFETLITKDVLVTKKSPLHSSTDKDEVSTSFTEELSALTLEIKDCIKDEARDIIQDSQTNHTTAAGVIDQLEKKVMSKLDSLTAAKGNNSLKLDQVARDLQDLKKSDDELVKKVSGLIRVSAHGNIKVYEELMALGANSESSFDKLSTEIKSQTKSLKKGQGSVSQNLTSEFSDVKDELLNQGQTLEIVKSIANEHTVALKDVKDQAHRQNREMSNIRQTVEIQLPEKVNAMLKENAQDQNSNFQSIIAQSSPEKYKKISHFSKRDDYENYVKETISPGMKVRYISDDNHCGLQIGHTGTVLRRRGEKVIKVEWNILQKNLEAYYYDVEIIG